MTRILIKAGTIVTMDDRRAIFTPDYILLNGSKVEMAGEWL